MSPQWDSQTLVQPITADSPCGESLEESPLLSAFDTFRLFGQAAPLDPVPDWGEIKNKALEALARSRDLRVLAYLGTAVLRTDGFPAFSDTLGIAAKWLETCWSEVHPQVTEDAIGRRSALNCFADQMAVIDGLRRIPLVSNRVHGTFSLRDIEIATGQIPPKDGEARPDAERIKAAFAAMADEELAGLYDSVVRATAAIKGIEARMRDAAGSDATPDFDALSAQLVKIERTLGAQIALRPGARGAAGAEAGGDSDAGGAVGVIRSRHDAIRALDAVADFFQRTEPSSPIPMFLARAKRLVSKDFLEVLADVAPDAVPQARAAGGLRQGE
jgi:type VI secretion system protein ImpA